MVTEHHNFSDRIKRIQRLINYGVLLGVSLPSLLYVIYGIVTDLIDERWHLWTLGCVLGYLVAMFLIGYYPPQWSQDQSTVEKHREGSANLWRKGLNLFKHRFFTPSAWTDNFFWIGGVLSIGMLYGLVLFSGGISDSPFSGYFIYVPAVVYIVFRDVRRVLMAGFVASVLVVVLTPCEIAPLGLGSCLLGLETWRDATSNLGYLIVYAIIVVWQISVAVIVARKSDAEATLNP